MEPLKKTNFNQKRSARKSSRHSKVSGQFGEIFVAYMLSKFGFEVAQVDHTGLDILAVSRNGKKRLGVSVKNRTRDKEGSNWTVNFPHGDLERLKKACHIFSAEPFVAVVVDRPNDSIDDSMWLTMWLMPLPTAKRKCTTYKNGILAFAVTQAREMHYRTLPDVNWVSLKSDSLNLNKLRG